MQQKSPNYRGGKRNFPKRYHVSDERANSPGSKGINAAGD